jgi:hypothetical protein
MMILRALARRMSSGIFVGTALLIALSLVVWFQGPRFRYLEYAPFASIINRMIAIGVLIVLWGINNFIIARRAARTKPKQQVEMEVKPRDPVEEEIALLRQSFRSTMAAIKSKWAGKERGSRSVYALPWYLVIGPSHSGKTSLVVDSDLKFPLSHILNGADAKSSRTSRIPQYWVTSESVLFDLPGVWVGQSFQTTKPDQAKALANGNGAMMLEDRTEGGEIELPLPPKPASPTREKRLWAAFMDLLVEFRPRRPINGVILCVDSSELVRATDESRVAMAAVLHSQLVELAERLGTRFTVHVVMTKIDRLAGFRDYFAQFSKQERMEPFGFSFPIYDEVSADKWVADFETHFAKFIDQANDDMIDKLCAQRDNSVRRSIYTFSREMAALGPIVADFFRRALHSDKFSTPPLTRGIYFTSTKQQGVPFDALLARVSRDYHMAPPVLPAYSGHSIRYFTEQLFHRSIFREAGLAGDNKTVERRKRVALHGSVLASVLALMGLGFILHDTMLDNSARAANVLSLSRDFVALPRSEVKGGSKEEDEYLPALNAIRAANQEFPGWQDKAEARRYLALYQGRRVGPEAEKAYEGLLRERYLPALAERVKQRIDLLGEDKDGKYSDERLDALRVYLLLGDLGKRAEMDASEVTADLGKKAILAWLKRDWQTRYEGKEQVQKDLADHLEFALETKRIATPLVAKRAAFETARKSKPLTSLEVGAVEIAGVIADWTGIPVSSMTQDEIANLLNLATVMKRTIKGQDHPLQVIEDHLQASKLDLNRAGRPLGVFLLVGPSGVGKTETALEVARRLFGGEQFLTTVNMTEYQEKHSLSRMIGSPPGYVGYGEGGVLTEAIRKKPYSVVLLDEVEKADPDVLNLFYQAFDKGDLADGEGRQIDCKNVVFFLTSNLASDQIAAFATRDSASAEEIEAAIRPLLAQHFKPALLARMQPLVYLPLGDEIMREIVAAKLADLKALLAAKQGIALTITGKAVARLEALCNDAASGARLIDQIIQKRLLPTISRQILQCRLDDRQLTAVTVDADDAAEFTFAFDHAAPAVQLEAAQ